MTRAYIFLFILGLVLFSSCKKDRHVRCEFDITGVYSGSKVSSGAGQATTVEENQTIEVKLKKGRALVVFPNGEESQKVVINDCTGGYTTEESGSFEFSFFKDSLHILNKPSVSNPAEQYSLNWYLSKD